MLESICSETHSCIFIALKFKSKDQWISKVNEGNLILRNIWKSVTDVPDTGMWVSGNIGTYLYSSTICAQQNSYSISHYTVLWLHGD